MQTEKDEIAELCRGWTPMGLALFYEAIFEEQGFKVPPHMWPVMLGICDHRIKRLMLVIGPGSGKSLTLSVTVPAWLLGHDPNLTVLGISGGEALMQGFQDAVATIIESSPAWRRVFPNVRPDKQAGWSTTKGIFVTGRAPGNPDASYLACGIDSKYLTGKHGKVIIIDDLHNEENSATADQCEKVVQKYAKTIVGRADPMGARFIIAGRRWHEDDIYGKLKNTDWVVLELPAEREGTRKLFYDVYIPDGLKCVFNDRHCLLGDGQLVKVC